MRHVNTYFNPQNGPNAAFLHATVQIVDRASKPMTPFREPMTNAEREFRADMGAFLFGKGQ